MADIGAQTNQGTQSKIDWRRLLVTLAVGGLITTICFILDRWWVATAFLVLTLFLACFSFDHKLYPLVFTVYAVFAIAWLTGSTLDQFLPVEGQTIPWWRAILPVVGGIVVGAVLPALFWFLVFLASTEWLMSVSETHGISRREARRFVAARTFGTAQGFFLVENGKLAVETPKGLLSKLGGPGTLVVRSGNAVVLERGSKITRVVGPGTYTLMPGENFKQPVEAKGIIDLRGRPGKQTVENTLTKDGIPLTFTIGGAYQLEPKSETDKRPSSRFEGGEATTPIIGAPEYPVYEATILKAVHNTGNNGINDMYPGGAVGNLRDVVATYTFDQIFPPSPLPVENPDPSQRIIKQIEDKVKASIDASGRGVLFRGIDIQEITMPEDVRKKVMERWSAPMERERKIKDAEATRDAMIVESEGRARSIEQLDRVKLASGARMVQIAENLAKTLPQMQNEAIASSFLSLVHELARRVGRDEASAARTLDDVWRAMSAADAERLISAASGPRGISLVHRPAIEGRVDAVRGGAEQVGEQEDE